MSKNKRVPHGMTKYVIVYGRDPIAGVHTQKEAKEFVAIERKHGKTGKFHLFKTDYDYYGEIK